MCEICNIERGREECLMEGDLELKLGRNDLGYLVAAVEIRCDDEGHTSLWFRITNDDDQPYIEMDMDIDYCPFCGRKLPHRDKTSLNG